MKVGLKYRLRGYSGKLGDMVYSSYYNYKLCHSRIFRYPTLTDTHSRMREINNNLNALYLQASDAYRLDWKRYAFAIWCKQHITFLKKGGCEYFEIKYLT